MKRSQGLRQRRSISSMILVGFMWCTGTVAATGDPDRFDFKLLATSRTSTMEKEMNQASALGFRLAAVMGGETSLGGSEVVVIMQKGQEGASGSYQYRLLATNKTSTMQKELTLEGENGFELAGMTVSRTTFGGEELVSILQRPVR